MSTAKFEKLIDLIINEDQERAEQLFHEIVVEKSREIYESLMSEDMTSDLIDEVSVEEEGMEGMMEDDEEFTDAEELDGDFDTDMDAESDMDDMEADMDDMDAEETDMEDSEDDLEDRVIDLEDKLDELMAEFEAKMGADEEEEGEEEEAEGEEEEAEGEEEAEELEEGWKEKLGAAGLAAGMALGGGHALNKSADHSAERSNVSAAAKSMASEKRAAYDKWVKATKAGDMEAAKAAKAKYQSLEEQEVMEAVEMKKVSVTHTDGSDSSSKKSTVAANSGKTGMASSPVKFSGDSEAVPTSPKGPSNAYAKGEGHLPGAGSFQNAPGGAKGVKGGAGQSAPKPKHETVKAHSPVAEGKKSTKRKV